MPRIIEAGHYYRAKGPTRWSEVGWEIMEKMRSSQDRSLLFIDDVHQLEDVSPLERDLPVNGFAPVTDFTVMESAMEQYALDALAILRVLPKKRKARQSRAGRWHCSGFSITDNRERPLCVLLDLGLSLYKWRTLGFQRGINVVPCFYQEEQSQLNRLMAKVMPNFSLEVMLYDLSGKCWPL